MTMLTFMTMVINSRIAFLINQTFYWRERIKKKTLIVTLLAFAFLVTSMQAHSRKTRTCLGTIQPYAYDDDQNYIGTTVQFVEASASAPRSTRARKRAGIR